jgi:hypothetical protein
MRTGLIIIADVMVLCLPALGVVAWALMGGGNSKSENRNSKNLNGDGYYK